MSGIGNARWLESLVKYCVVVLVAYTRQLRTATNPCVVV